MRAIEPALEVHESQAGIEVSWDGGGRVFQIFLGERSGAVNVPYWEANRSPEVAGRIERLLRIAHEELGFLAYDPQTDLLVPLDKPLVLDERVFDESLAALQRVTAQKPWWKFW